MNWTYNDAPLLCEECGKVLEEHSGYTVPQYGICNECYDALELDAVPSTYTQEFDEFSDADPGL
jgi:hypothetical protein